MEELQERQTGRQRELCTFFTPKQCRQAAILFLFIFLLHTSTGFLQTFLFPNHKTFQIQRPDLMAYLPTLLWITTCSTCIRPSLQSFNAKMVPLMWLQSTLARVWSCVSLGIAVKSGNCCLFRFWPEKTSFTNFRRPKLWKKKTLKGRSLSPSLHPRL